VDQLRFDSGLGTYNVNVVPDSVMIVKGIGAHKLQLTLEVGIPEVAPKAGRLLQLDAALYVPQSNGPRALLGMVRASVAFRSTGEIRRETLEYLITNSQLLALEQRRVGALRLELLVRGFLPQCSGFPGGSDATEHIRIAESEWRGQLAALGHTLGAEMTIPFPADDDGRRGVADFLREAQRLLGGNEIDSAMLQARKGLETIKHISGWNLPGKKEKGERTVDERWAVIRAAMEDQASGAMHVDPGTKDHQYTRGEVEAVIAMTACLLYVVP
jgi:hypothetical protein